MDNNYQVENKISAKPYPEKKQKSSRSHETHDQNSNIPYAPDLRNYLEADVDPFKSHSLYDYTVLPDNVEDPIVVNNIANQEFDYTYNCESDIFDDYDDTY